jgi:hypothetical protein
MILEVLERIEEENLELNFWIPSYENLRNAHANKIARLRREIL